MSFCVIAYFTVTAEIKIYASRAPHTCHLPNRAIVGLCENKFNNDYGSLASLESFCRERMISASIDLDLPLSTLIFNAPG